MLLSSDVDLRSFYDRASEFSSARACWRGCETRTVERGGLTTSHLTPSVSRSRASVKRGFTPLAVSRLARGSFTPGTHLERVKRHAKQNDGRYETTSRVRGHLRISAALPRGPRPTRYGRLAALSARARGLPTTPIAFNRSFASRETCFSVVRRSSVSVQPLKLSPTYYIYSILTATGRILMVFCSEQNHAARSAAGRATGPHAAQRNSPLAAPHAVAKVTSASAFLSVTRPPP